MLISDVWVGLGYVALAGLLIWGLRKAWRPLWAVGLLAIFYPRTLPQVIPVGNAPTTALQYSIAVFVVVGLALCIKICRPNRREFAPFLLLLLPLAVSVVRFDVEPGAIFAAERPLFVVAGLLTYVAMLQRRAPEKIERTYRLIPIVGVVQAAIAVVQYSSGSWGIYETETLTADSFAGRAAGSFGHPTVYGFFAAVALLIAVQQRHRLWGLLAVANGAGLLLSGSRTAIIAVAVGLLVMLIIGRRRTGRPPSSLTVAVAVAGTIPLMIAVATVWPTVEKTVGDVYTARFVDAANSTSFVAHDNRQAAAWRLISDNPATFLFGNGPQAAANYLDRYNLFDDQAATFDNAYLTLWIDYGLIAMIVLATIIVRVLLRRKATIPVAAAIFTSFYAFDFLDWPIMVLLLALCLGVPVGARAVSPGAAQQDTEHDRRARQGVGGVRADAP